MPKDRKPARYPKELPHRGGGRKNQSPYLPETCVVAVTEVTEDGELVAVPVNWDVKRKPPHIVVTESGRGQAATVGDKLLVKLRRIHPHLYQALAIRVLPSDAPRNVIGMLVMTSDGGIIEPISRKLKESFMVARSDLNGAQHGELVAAITTPGTPSMSMVYAKITERLGSLGSPKAASLIATHMHELPTEFSPEALAEAEDAEPPVLSDGRVDLRELPLVTIDGADARDFDDAVFAEPTKDGFHLVVAIADVAHYVTPDSALDHEAQTRGNSVYFPDRVIPMLPERLSNGLCSLMPDDDRYCLAVHLWIDKNGEVEKYEFVRGIMRSRARLTYEEVEEFSDQSSESRKKSKLNSELWSLLTPLWHAYAALAKERDERGALDLNLPEYKIIFDASGNVANIAPKARLESHRLIETFMIAANVAAADFLIKHHAPGIFRVHEAPSDEKLEDLRNLLKMSGYGLAKGDLKAKHFNHVLHKSEGEPNAFMIHTAVLRAQMQAYYAAENLGHFGLALAKYCHFTSPIRRYADLVVHRSLCDLVDRCQVAGDRKKNLTPDTRHLSTVALHISETERKAMMAERDASDRYKVSYMARQIGNVFSGTIAGMNEHGLFVALADNGVQGFIPVRHMGQDFFIYDKRHSCFRGQRTKKQYTIGDPMLVRVAEANAMTGSLMFFPADASYSASPRPHAGKHKGKHKGKKKSSKFK
ncbi:MAG: ribonuclease R [Alphaproteobacteria bacterium]|nr:ribonuclease R [Alphaproteobacteria bacterium]